ELERAERHVQERAEAREREEAARLEELRRDNVRLKAEIAELRLYEDTVVRRQRIDQLIAESGLPSRLKQKPYIRDLISREETEEGQRTAVRDLERLLGRLITKPISETKTLSFPDKPNGHSHFEHEADQLIEKWLLETSR